MKFLRDEIGDPVLESLLLLIRERHVLRIGADAGQERGVDVGPSELKAEIERLQAERAAKGEPAA